MIDERKFMILQAIIDDYIMTAIPVGSRTISRKEGVTFSPATIRNEMSDLEEMGFLAQPHTSAGRIPSHKAYRLYVDNFIKRTDLTDTERSLMIDHLQSRSNRVEQVIKNAAKVLSDATMYTSIISAPRLNSLKISRVQLVPITQGTALMVIVTNEGLVKDAVIRVPEGVNEDDLYRISRMLTEALNNKPLSEIRQIFAGLFRDLTENRRLLAQVMRVMEEKLEDEQSQELYIGGSGNLLSYPEYADIDAAREFLSVIESKDRLLPLLKRPGGVEISVRIGPETGIDELKNCSVVTATYKVGDQGTGTLGIIGPTRMNYSRVMSVLGFMGKAVSDLLSGDDK